jgi:GxxExxY protein
MLRVPTPLSDETEAIVHKTIGCCIAVHRVLGPGLLESICSRAVCIELEHAGLPFECERRVPVFYREQLLCHQRLDIVVAEQVLLEIKSVDRLNPVHHAQVLTYLRLAGFRVGLLVNFNVPILQEGLKRIVL